MRAVIGQERMLDHLGARAVRGELSHAYGLFGPRSVGKRTVAIRLAQTANCLDATRPVGGCGTCRSCTNIERGVHPDVRLIERDPVSKNIGIAQIRDMQRDLAFRPLEGRVRFVIIDDAAELHEHAQDALLKTLEEPPRHAVLLLVTLAAAPLHETIRSRVQSLRFRSVATAEIAAGLRERGVKDADALAATANGRPGLALRLATDEGGERSMRRTLEAELFRLIGSGLTDRFAWAAELAAGSPDTEEGRRRRTDALDARFDHWSELLRDAAVSARGLSGVPLRPERQVETAKIGAKNNARELVDAALLIERLRRDLTWNANPRMMLELLALRLPHVAELAA